MIAPPLDSFLNMDSVRMALAISVNGRNASAKYDLAPDLNLAPSPEIGPSPTSSVLGDIEF